MTDGSARDAALVHSDVVRERRRAGPGSRCRESSRPTSQSYTLSCVGGLGPALLSAAAPGMMALTGIVFAMAFVMVQFSAIAYFPRLVLWFARDRTLFHAPRAFTDTFVYAFMLAWVDCGASAKVPVAVLLVGMMIIVCMLMFSRLIKRLGDLQIGKALHLVANRDDRHRRPTPGGQVRLARF